jgi:SAM-dependent methyltransferase
MRAIFGSTYADAYNQLYHDKNYSAECDLIEELFRRYSSSPVSSVVDFGCGTGNHVFPLSRRGYDILGVDRAESMLALAQKRLAADGGTGRVRFQQGDIRSVDLGRTFDAALMMFAVLGYQVENGDVLAALRTARRHLEPGALLIVDFWYGPAVLHQRPSERIKIIPLEDGSMLRASSGDLDTARNTVAVRFHLWQLSNDRLVAETDETHLMRYFFLQEIKLLLECTGLSLMGLGAFPDFDRQPDETTWNVLGVARAVVSRDGNAVPHSADLGI